MKLDLVSPTVGANYHGLRLDLRIGMLTDMENNEMHGTREFIYVWASMRIRTLHPMCASSIMIF
jgi:hypothetical protein